MHDETTSVGARRRRVEKHVRFLSGGVASRVVWSADGGATVLGPDGEPYLVVEATDGHEQLGIRVVRVGGPRKVMPRSSGEPVRRGLDGA